MFRSPRTSGHLQSDDIAIGAGQAGLASGHHLAVRGADFLLPRCRTQGDDYQHLPRRPRVHTVRPRTADGATAVGALLVGYGTTLVPLSRRRHRRAENGRCLLHGYRFRRRGHDVVCDGQPPAARLEWRDGMPLRRWQAPAPRPHLGIAERTAPLRFALRTRAHPLRSGGPCRRRTFDGPTASASPETQRLRRLLRT